MMRKLIPCLLLYFLKVIALQAQQDIQLSGVVVLQNSKFNTGKVVYLSKAQIKSIGATPRMSDTDGKFTLIFSDKEAGSETRIYAAKSGYEVVNEELLQHAILGKKGVFKVVLCEEGALYENQLTYYNIAKDAYLAAYNKRVVILEKEGAAQAQLLVKMEQEFKQKINSVEQANELLLNQLQASQAQAQNLADKWVTVNLDDQSENYQEAYRKFIAKDIEGALQILNAADLEQRLATNLAAKEKEGALVDELKEEIAQKKIELEQDISQCLFKAELHKLRFEFDKVEKMYELALKYDEDNIEVLADYAIYLYQQKQMDKTDEIYTRVVTLAQKLVKDNPQKYWGYLSVFYNNFALLHQDRNDYAKAEELYKKSLKICYELAEENPMGYLPHIGGALINLGILNQKKLDYDKARNYYEKALKLFRKLEEDKPGVHVAKLSAVLLNLGTLQEASKDFPAAEASYSEALELVRGLVKNGQQKFLLPLARNLVHLGTIQGRQKKTEKAEAAFQEGLLITRQLAKENPNAYVLNLATVLNSYAVFKESIKDYEKAEVLYLESLTIRRALAQGNPQVYLPFLGRGLENIGRVNFAMKKFSSAKDSYEEALTLYKSGAVENAGFFQPEIAAVMLELGKISYELFDRENTKRYYAGTLPIYRELSKEKPGIYLNKEIVVLNKIKKLQNQEDDEHGLMVSCQAVLAAYRKLALIEKAYLHEVAFALDELSYYQFAREDYEKVEASYNEMLEIYETFYARDSTEEYFAYLTELYGNFGLLYQETKQYDKARAYLQKSVEQHKILAVDKPLFFLPKLATRLDALRAFESELGNEKEAIAWFEEYIAVRRILAKSEKTMDLTKLGKALEGYAHMQLDRKKPDKKKVEATYFELLELHQKLYEQLPRVFIITLTVTKIKIGTFYLEVQKNRKKSIQFLDEAVDLLLLRDRSVVEKTLKFVYEKLEKWGIDIEVYKAKKEAEFKN